MTTHFPNMANGASPPPGTPMATTPPPLPPRWQFAHLIRKPGDPIVNQRVEFAGLSQKVRNHLVNAIGAGSKEEAARLLWVQGRPGEGKTEGCLLACLAAGYHVAVISPGLFAGEVEGASVQMLHAIMDEMALWSAVHGCRVVVLIDDFDLSTANVKENQGSTVNSQLLVNEVMQLASNRHLYRNADMSNIQIIFTVNDATGMRESLTRPGRSTFYEHAPSREDRANIAWAVLDPKTTSERDVVAALVRRHIGQPVSFWKALFFEMQELSAGALTAKSMPTKATIDRVHGQRVPITSEIAWTAAKNVRRQRARVYLNKRRWFWSR